MKSRRTNGNCRSTPSALPEKATPIPVTRTSSAPRPRITAWTARPRWGSRSTPSSGRCVIGETLFAARDDVDELEHREVHGDDHAAHDGTHDHDHDRLGERGQEVHRRVALVDLDVPDCRE